MKLFRFLLLISLVSLTISCGSDEEEEGLTKAGPFQISELSGSWVATQAQFTSNAEFVDIVADGGSVEMTVQSSGRFTITIDPVDRDAYTATGEMFWEEWQGSFYFAIVWDEDPSDWDTYGHNYDGNRLTLNGGADTGEYDFNNDGTSESCSIYFTFDRL